MKNHFFLFIQRVIIFRFRDSRSSWNFDDKAARHRIQIIDEWNKQRDAVSKPSFIIEAIKIV